MKIVYLYTELMGYNITVIKEFVEKYDAEVHIVFWDKKKLTPYLPPKLKNVTYYHRSDFDKKKLNELLSKIHPSIIYVSGWQDKMYLSVVKKWKKKGTPIVCGFDGQWKGTLRQHIGVFLFPILFKKYYSHVWVAGIYQYEFVRKLGFKKNEIIYDLYSADINTFNQAYVESESSKKEKYPHRFLFIGRFSQVKAIDILLEAWKRLGTTTKDWELCLIGAGDLGNEIKKYSNVVVKPFLSSEELKEELKNTGCFILPSRSEPWGVVIHEAASAGLPILCSDVVGAASTFVISGYNGYTFKSENIESLKNKLTNLILKSDDELIRMGKNSHLLGQRITPETSAANFVSIIENKL